MYCLYGVFNLPYEISKKYGINNYIEGTYT